MEPNKRESSPCKIEVRSFGFHSLNFGCAFVEGRIASYDACFDVLSRCMTGITEQVALIQEGLRALIECEGPRCLAQLNGSEPQLESISRCHSDAK